MTEPLIGMTNRVLRVPTIMLAALLLFSHSAAAQRPDDGEDHSDEWRVNFVPYFWAIDVDADIRINDRNIDFNPDFKGFSDGKYDPRASGMYFETFKDDWGGIVRLEFREAETAIPELEMKEVEISTIIVDVLAAHETILTLKGTKITLIPWIGFRYRDHDQFIRFDDDTEVNEGNGTFEPVIGARAEWQLNKWLALGTMVDASGFGVGDAPEMHGIILGEVKLLLSKEFSLALGYRYDDFEIRNTTFEMDGTMQGPYVALALDFWGKPVPGIPVWDGGVGIVSDEETTLPDEVLPDLNLTEEQKKNFFLRWLDSGHDYVNRKVETGVGSVDEALVKGDAPVVERERSRVAIALYTEVAEDDGVEWSFRPKYEGDIALPNLERNIRVRIFSESVDEIEGSDVLDQEVGMNAGLESQFLGLKKTKLQLGVRSSFDVYGAASWMPEWRSTRWRIGPKFKGFYRSDRGWGAEGSARFNYRIRDRFRASYIASILEEEILPSTEWLQSLNFIYLFEGDEQDFHRAFLTRIMQRGSFDDGTTLIRWTPIYYRAPLYRKWIYFEIGPEVRWDELADWEPIPSLRFAIQTMFWGSSER